MIFNVVKLELESHMVRLFEGALLEGSRNGYMEKPAVSMTQATATLLLMKAMPGRPKRDSSTAASVMTKTRVGINHSH